MVMPDLLGSSETRVSLSILISNPFIVVSCALVISSCFVSDWMLTSAIPACDNVPAVFEIAILFGQPDHRDPSPASSNPQTKPLRHLLPLLDMSRFSVPGVHTLTLKV